LGKCYRFDYPDDNVSKSQLFLEDLKCLGLLLYKESEQTNSCYYYPTQLALHFTSFNYDVSKSATSMSNQAAPGRIEGDGTTFERGWIILGTDYRLYAYTSNELHILLLSFFTFLEYRLPNLVVGVINRESIRAGLGHGIHAQDILNFIERNAHPQMRKQKPVIPETVADEIRVWENEKNRVSFNPGILVENIPVDVIETVIKYTKDVGAHLYSNSAVGVIMVTEPCYEDLVKFIAKKLPNLRDFSHNG